MKDDLKRLYWLYRRKLSKKDEIISGLNKKIERIEAEFRISDFKRESSEKDLRVLLYAERIKTISIFGYKIFIKKK